MTAVLDVVVALRSALEPDAQVDVDETGTKPIDWEAAEPALYVFPLRLREAAFETGPTARQDFAVAAVIVAPSDEEARRRIDVDLADWLDEKLGAYLDVVRRNRSTALWHHLEAAERPAPQVLTARARALEISGFRFVGDA